MPESGFELRHAESASEEAPLEEEEQSSFFGGPVGAVSTNRCVGQTLTLKGEKVGELLNDRSACWTGACEGFPREKVLIVYARIQRGDTCDFCVQCPIRVLPAVYPSDKICSSSAKSS